MKAKFVVGQKVQFATMPIKMTVIAVNRIPKSKYQSAHFAYWCDAGQNIKPTQVEEQDLIEA